MQGSEDGGRPGEAPLASDWTDTSVDLDRVFSALSHSTRRRILRALALRDAGAGGLDPAALAGDRASGEADAPGEADVELYHVHLPRLDRTGFVDWDRERDVVTEGARFEQVRPFLEYLEEAERGSRT